MADESISEEIEDLELTDEAADGVEGGNMLPTRERALISKTGPTDSRTTKPLRRTQSKTQSKKG